jgi:type I restriction-modification system DNA methylase subunit
MLKTYICELCKNEFKEKIDFIKHKNNREPCVITINMQNNSQLKTEYKINLSTIFNYCLDVLRNNEHLTGDKALRTLAHLLDLRLLEPRFGNEINIDNYEYDFSSYNDDIIENHKAKLLRLVRFSNLVKEKEEDLPKIMKCLWDDILSVHPNTKHIFLIGKGFDIQHQSTYKKIIDKLYTCDFEAVDEDILGEAYEEVIKDVMTGKVLGQFFTPPKVKQMMINLVDPQLNQDGTIETIFDPAMGTGGFLISSLRHLIKQSKTKGIKMDWNFISKKGLGGREAEPDTYQLAVSNMLISSGHMFSVLEKGDSIRNPITNKYDIIFANPPFGINGLIYHEILHPLRNEYIPIKTNNAVTLFLQAIIYMLNIDGRACVVLPHGKELFSKNNEYIKLREFLTKTCDLKEIIHLPSGIFTHTSIKTCVFYFVKKSEGNDVLETKLKVSKTQKEIGRDYKFSKTHQTTNVKFYDYNPYEEIKTLLVEVPIDKIMSNSYSLNCAEYIKDETKEKQYEEGVVMKTLGEVCNFKNGQNITKSELIDGIYPVVGGGQSPLGHHDSYNVDENTLLISKDGAYAGFVSRYNTKVFVSNHGIFISKYENYVNKDYIYYYLKMVLQEKIYKLQTGTAQPGVNKAHIANLKIPIPSLERQQEIVKYLDFIYEKANKTSNEKIAELKQLNAFCLKNQKDNVVKTLGEVCSIDYGTRIVKGNNTEGEYPVYGSGRAMFSTNTFNREGYNILIGRFALSLECVRFINVKIFLNDSGLSVKPKTDILLHKYIGYYLLHNQSIIYNCARGTAQKNLEMDIFKSIIIPIPSLERQKEIVEYCEYNDTLIKQLEKEIENNKKQAKQFISSLQESEIEMEMEINEPQESDIENEIVSLT